MVEDAPEGELDAPMPVGGLTVPRPGARQDLAGAYQEHHEALVRQAYLLVGSAEEAADLVQDVFVRCHRHWNNVADPAPYLRRAVVNACKSHHRKNFVRRAKSRWEPTSGPTRPDAPGDEMSDVLLSLPYRQRAAIVLHFYSDLSENDIASVLRCRPGTVGSLIHRGLEELRKVLEP